jgi:hypothetical protein
MRSARPAGSAHRVVGEVVELGGGRVVGEVLQHVRPGPPPLRPAIGRPPRRSSGRPGSSRVLQDHGPLRIRNRTVLQSGWAGPRTIARCVAGQRGGDDRTPRGGFDADVAGARDAGVLGAGRATRAPAWRGPDRGHGPSPRTACTAAFGNKAGPVPQGDCDRYTSEAWPLRDPRALRATPPGGGADVLHAQVVTTTPARGRRAACWCRRPGRRTRRRRPSATCLRPARRAARAGGGVPPRPRRGRLPATSDPGAARPLRGDGGHGIAVQAPAVPAPTSCTGSPTPRCGPGRPPDRIARIRA